jgi:3',5'-cyclic-AMP phosphodiesterase
MGKHRFFFFWAVICAFITSCSIKDSVFDSEVKITTLWNQKFTVPSYNMAGGDVVRFAILTDSHENYADLRSAIRNINNAGVQFVIHTGDFTDFGSGDEFELFVQYLKELNVPSYIVPGNHDMVGAGRKLYNKVFGPENRAITTDFGKMIFWNNNRMEIKKVDYDFLDSEVASANNAKPVLLFHHQDPFNELPFSEEDNDRYLSIVQSHPQVVVFHGHLHRFFKRFYAGINFFQISRTEGGKWGLVEVDNTNIRIYYCTEKNCQLESTL